MIKRMLNPGKKETSYLDTARPEGKQCSSLGSYLSAVVLRLRGQKSLQLRTTNSNRQKSFLNFSL